MLEKNHSLTTKFIKIILALWIILLLSYRISICFSYLPELSNGESNNIWKAINVAHGKPMYTDPEKLPLEVFQYTPISQFPIVVFAKTLDDKSPQYLYFVTALGRLYELLVNVLLIMILYFITKKWLNTSKITSTTIALICFSLFTNPAFTIRPDATLLLLLILSIWSFLKMENSENLIWIIITSLLIISCFYTKQDGILIAGPIGIRLLMLKKWRLLILLSTMSALLLTITISISPLIFGEDFYSCVFKGLKNTSSIVQIIHVFDRAFSFYAFHFILGLITSFYFLYKHSKEKIALFSLISIFYFLVALATSSKSGSWVNYYTPFIIFASITIIYFLSKLQIESKKLNPIFTFSISICIAFLFILKQVYVYTSPFLIHTKGKNEYYSNYQNIQIVKSRLGIKKEDKILTINQLDRNFLAENSIMINTEYYNYASYTYDNFKKNKNKQIQYIIYKEKDKPTLNYLLQFFNVSTENYSEFKINNFHILKKV
jgi:hypothetical protein